MVEVVEDPSSYTYIRPEGAGLMVGLFEAEAASWNVKSVPQDFSFGDQRAHDPLSAHPQLGCRRD